MLRALNTLINSLIINELTKQTAEKYIRANINNIELKSNSFLK